MFTNESFGLHAVSESDADTAHLLLEAQGWKVFQLPSKISTASQFIKAVQHNLPLDPPLSGQVNWDALSDSLWSGLHALQMPRILIIWRDASCLKNKDSAAFSIIGEIMSDITQSLADPTLSNGKPKTILVLLAV